MADKSWYMDRRTFLKGTGVALGLPFLDCMRSPLKRLKLVLGHAQTDVAIHFPMGQVYQRNTMKIAIGDGFRCEKETASVYQGATWSRYAFTPRLGGSSYWTQDRWSRYWRYFPYRGRL